MSKKQTTIGIDYDRAGIRGARMVSEELRGDRLSAVERVEEVSGAFDNPDELVEGLAGIRKKLEAGTADMVVSCVGGKQVYAAQMPFRRLADDETRRALRFELRKKIPFEVAGSTIDYQVLRAAEKAGDNSELLVTVVANALLHQHLRIMEKAGMKPHIVDVIPTAAANAVVTTGARDGNGAGGGIVVHVGPDTTNLVFELDGPFFTRSFAFDAHGLSETNPAAEPTRQLRDRLTLFSQEILRSVSYYEKTFKVEDFGAL